MDDFSNHPDYSDPERNLQRLKETNLVLSSGAELSDVWKREHCVHIMYYKWAIAKANPAKESESPDYQKVVHELITLLDSLCRNIQTTGTFLVNNYRSAVTRLLHVIQEAASMYELEDAMNDLLT